MYYKLFLMGSSTPLATIELMGPPAQAGDIFMFRDTRYKVIHALYFAREISFDDKGARKWEDNYTENERLAELYITEVPKF